MRTITTTGAYPNSDDITIDLSALGAREIGSKKIDLDFECQDVQILEESEVDENLLLEAGLTKQPDLMYVRWKLVHAKTNKNRDKFLASELKKAYKSALNKYVTWEHGSQSIGTIYSSKFIEPPKSKKVDSKKETPYIQVDSIIWKKKYPEESKEIYKRYLSGNLMSSVAGSASIIQCSECEEEFGAEDEICECLKNRFDSNSKATRVPKGILIEGMGVVKHPADDEAEALSIAASNRKENLNLEKIYSEEELKQRIEEAVNALSNKSTMEDLTSEVEALKASVVEKTKLLDEATANLKSLTEERDTFKASLDKIEKETKDKETYDNRLKSLVEAGFTAPENDEEKTNHKTQVLAMDESVFNYHVQTLKSMSSKVKTEPKKSEAPSVTTVEASLNSVRSLKSEDLEDSRLKKFSELAKLVNKIEF